MKILVVQQHHICPGQPGGSRFQEMGKTWLARGHQVSVIAGTLNYATGDRDPGIGSRWCLRRDEDGISVWRCYVPSSYNRGFTGRAWALLGFAISGSWAAIRADRPDVVIASSPPLTALMPAWVATARHRGTPWIFEVRDLWPESAVTTGVVSATGTLRRLLGLLESWACRRSTAITVLTPAFRDDLVGRGLANDAKISLVPNGADVHLFTPGGRDNAARRAFGWGDRLVALYAGAHGKANAIGQLVEAAALLKDRSDVLVATVGDGPERGHWEAEARRRGLANIVFHGAQPKERMPEIVNAADVGVAVLQDNPTFRTVYPNKVFDYMACARPVLLAIDGVARDLVCDQAHAGVFVRPEDPAAFVQGLARLFDPELRQRLGENGRTWVLAHATREALADQYLDVLRRLVGSGAADAVPVATG